MLTSPLDINQLQSQQSYTDLHQLNDIRKLGHKDQSLALEKVAQQFESMFIQMLLKSMRTANAAFEEQNPLNSSEMKFHRDMFDNQLSVTLANSKGLGIAEALYRQLQNSYLPSDKLTNPEQTPEALVFDRNRTLSESPYSKPVSELLQGAKDSKQLNSIHTPADFIDAVTPYAKKIAAEMGVDHKVLVAQAALETGWGEHVIRDGKGNHSFNLFNIKADSRWAGDHVTVATLEYRNGVAAKEKANFRQYTTIAESFDDYQNFLQQPRYQKAMAAVADSTQFIEELQNAGYATDPRYAEKIQRILNDYWPSVSK